MKKQVKLIPENSPNRPGTKITRLAMLVFHNTGNEALSATDEANIKYMGRKFVLRNGEYFEADGKTPFRYGSANTFIDDDSATVGIPLGEKTYNSGDRQLPYNNGFKGQTKLAASYGHAQNSLSWSYEMCQNKNWPQVVLNTIEEVVDNLIEHKVDIESVVLLRHFDLSGKRCPARFVDHEDEWKKFKDDIRTLYYKKIKGTPAEKEKLKTRTAVNFRKQPSQTSEKVMAGQIPRNATLEVMGGEENKYIKVRYLGMVGYVHTAYVEKI